MGAGESPWRPVEESGWQELSTSGSAHGRTISDEVWHTVQERSGRKFTVDACGSAPVSPDCMVLSPSSFMSAQAMVGQHVWLLPPVSDVSAFLQQYRKLKEKSPHTTTACIMVPQWKGQHWDQYLRGMRLVAQYAKGAAVFSNGDGGLERSKWGWNVWCDDGVPRLKFNVAKRSKLTMSFRATVAGETMPTLLDSGCSCPLVVAHAARRAGVKVSPTQHSAVSLGDGQATAPVLGECVLPVKIQGYRAKVKAYVLESLVDGYELVLGDSWFLQNHVVLDYDRRCAHVRVGTRRLTLQPTLNTVSDELPAQREHKVLSAMQMKRVVAKAGKREELLFLVHVREAEDDAASHARERQAHHAVGNAPADGVGTGEGSTSDGLLPEWWVQDLLGRYRDVFPDELPAGLPPDRGVGHTIPIIPGSKPPSRPLYRLSPLEMEEVKRQVKDLLAKGLIEPSKSPYGAPILFVQKKDGTLRMCVDYRALNKITVRNQYPLPRIDDLLDCLSGVKVASSLDLVSGYHQIRISEEDVPKTAFKTPMGLYQFKVLSFGLTNAPSTFQAVMSSIFGDLIGKCVLVYLDDLLVVSKSPEEHKVHLEMVLQRLREHKLYAKLSKCSFGKSELEFLGHVVGRDGIKVDPRKVAAVCAMRAEEHVTNVTQLRSFLGMANYYRRFMKDYASNTALLTSLTGSKSEWDGKWTPEMLREFKWVQESLTNAPTLAPFDPEKLCQLVVTADASVVGLGAVLEQEGRPVAFESRKLTSAEKNYTTTEQELLGVVHALKTWRCYLESGTKFLVRTDHNPNVYFSTKPMLSRREARWSEYLQQFHFDWQYKPGKENVVADHLSRMPMGALLISLPQLVLAAVTTRRKAREQAVADAAQVARTEPHPGAEEVLKEYREAGVLPVLDVQPPKTPRGAPDTVNLAPAMENTKEIHDAKRSRRGGIVGKVKAAYADDPLYSDAEWTAASDLLRKTDGLWWRGSRIAVPDSEAVKSLILLELHNSPIAGHVGVTKTIQAAKTQFWWPRMDQEIQEWVSACESCQRNKGNRRNKGLLQPLQVPTRAWESVGMDLITQLPVTVRGHDAIVVFIDRLTKMVHFAPTTTTVTAQLLAKVFVREVWRLHGVPKELVTDRGSQFTSEFWREVCRLVGTKQCMTTAYHPQANGQTERTNSTLEGMLRHFVSREQNDWDDWLDCAEFAINNSWQESVQNTPFRLNYGQDPLTPLTAQLGDRVPAADKLVGRVRELIAHAKECMERAQQRQKSYADESRVEEVLEPGVDQVMLHTKNLKLQGTKKLLPRWLGPFEILERIGEVSYKLALPKAMRRIHPVFHVSLLKRFKASVSGGESRPPMPLFEDVGGPVFEVERILSHRDMQQSTGKGRRKKTVRQYLIRWKGYDSSNDTWEPESNLVDGVDAMLAEYWEAVAAAE